MAFLRLKFLKQNNKDIIQPYNNDLLEISACEVNCSVNLILQILAYFILKHVLLVPVHLFHGCQYFHFTVSLAIDYTLYCQCFG